MGEELVVKAAKKIIGLDVLGGELAYISHAHSDHSEAVGGPLPIFCSDATADLLGLEEKGERKPAGDLAQKTDAILKPAIEPPAPPKRGKRSLNRKIRIEIPEGIELFSAGHILGSTQLVAESEAHGKLVYTGDFKIRDGLTVKAAPILQCDTLIAECTYGDPAVSFPDAEGVRNDMERWSRQHADCNQVWGGYATGKAQEIVKFLNDFRGVVPVVSERIAQVCTHYGRHGVKMEWLTVGTAEAEEEMRGPFSCVLPAHVVNQGLAARLAGAHRRKTLTALTTGWALVRPLSCDGAFALSDHADYGELLEYCQASQAKQVYLAHGDNEHTAKALRMAGIHAAPISEIGEGKQMRLEVVAEK